MFYLSRTDAGAEAISGPVRNQSNWFHFACRYCTNFRLIFEDAASNLNFTGELVDQSGRGMRDQTSELLDPVARLREFIKDGGFADGGRLPPERQLSDQLGLSRAALRKALDALERDGLIWRHVGKGTFVADGAPLVEAEPPVLMADLARQLTPFRMMRARMAIEPAIAREAAVNASAEALQTMRRAIQRSKDATTWKEYEVQDDLFHRSVAEASDNLLLLTLFDQLNEVRRAVAWGSVTRETARPSLDHSSFPEHDAIAVAIADRDPGAAYEAMRKHLGSVARRLFGEV